MATVFNRRYNAVCLIGLPVLRITIQVYTFLYADYNHYDYCLVDIAINLGSLPGSATLYIISQLIHRLTSQSFFPGISLGLLPPVRTGKWLCFTIATFQVDFSRSYSNRPFAYHCRQAFNFYRACKLEQQFLPTGQGRYFIT